jgi:DNA-binding MarR family transcriptional regulator
MQGVNFMDSDTQHSPETGCPFEGSTGIGETTVLQILRVADLLTRIGDTRVFHQELTQAQFNVLMILKRLGDDGMSQKDIREHLVCTKGNVSIHITNLTRMGYIRKRISKADSRVNVITLAAKGRRILAHLEPRYLQHLSQITKDLPREEAQRVVTLLSHLEATCEAELSRSDTKEQREGTP